MGPLPDDQERIFNLEANFWINYCLFDKRFLSNIDLWKRIIFLPNDSKNRSDNGKLREEIVEKNKAFIPWLQLVRSAQH